MKKTHFLPSNPVKCCKATGKDLKVHFKNTRETAAAIKGMNLSRAKNFLKNIPYNFNIETFLHFFKFN